MKNLKFKFLAVNNWRGNQLENLDKIFRSFYAKANTTFYAKGTLAYPLSNVHRCWLTMPLVAGFLRWVLACRTIERTNKSLVWEGGEHGVDRLRLRFAGVQCSPIFLEYLK